MAAYKRAADVAIADAPSNVVELHTAVCGPVPVKTKCDCFADSAEDVLIVEVGVGVADSNLPGTHAVSDAAIAGSHDEEFFEWLDSSERT